MEDYINLEKETLTPSALRTYGECPRKYQHMYIDCIDIYAEPLAIKDSSSMSTGSCIHQCLDAIYGGCNDGNDNGNPYDKVTHRIDTTSYQQVINQYKVDGITHNPITVSASILINAHLQLIDEGVIQPYHYIAKELKMVMHHKPHAFSGKTDGIVALGVNHANGINDTDDADGTDDANDADDADGGHYIIDHKSGQLPKAYQYQHDFQQMLYCMEAVHQGYNIQGYIIDGWRIPTLGYKSNESHDDYIERVTDIVVETTRKYEEEGIERGLYFNTLVYDVSREELVRQYQTVRYMADMIAANTQHGLFMQNMTHNCINKWGSRCPFYAICHYGVDVDACPRVEGEHGHVELVD